MLGFKKIQKKQDEEDDKKIDAFMQDYEDVCKKHKMRFVLSVPQPQRLILTPIQDEEVKA